VQRAKEPDGERRAHDGTDHAISTIFHIAEPVAVLEPHHPRPNGTLPVTHVVRRPHIVAQYLAAPAVVVAGDPEDLHTGVACVSQRG